MFPDQVHQKDVRDKNVLSNYKERPKIVLNMLQRLLKPVISDVSAPRHQARFASS